MKEPRSSPLGEERTLDLTHRGGAESGPWMLEVGTAETSRRAALEPGRALVVGSGRDADVRVLDRTVSARHCVVRSTSEGVLVEDAGSRNGVFVGGVRVTRALLTGTNAAFVIGHSSLVLTGPSTSPSDQDSVTVPGLTGHSEAIQRVAREVLRHAKLRAPVLLQGESGTGKDVVARALHAQSGRTGPYLPLNVGAITESLADAELFGHVRGAFTGAVAARPGAFEQAQRGTLFLDEIAELAPSMQVKLLRVVEDGVVRPVGAAQPLRVDVRLVSASWASLDDCVSAGRFRFDLYQRLSTVVIRLPPLRQRKSDIPALADVLLARFEPELGKKRLSSLALGKLVAHSWPGNVRELGTVLYRAAVASSGEIIDASQVQVMERAGRVARATALTPSEVLALFDRNRQNVAASARAANVPRTTFRAWLKRAREA